MTTTKSRRLTGTTQLLIALSLIAAACGSSEAVTATTDSSSQDDTAMEDTATEDTAVAVADSSTVTVETDDDPLVRCETIETPTTNLTANLGQRNPDDLAMGVLLTYAEENPNTFAGLWIDRDSGGVVMVAFTDDPEPHRQALLARGPLETDVATVEPRLPITDPRPLGERDDFVLDVVQMEHAEAVLEETQNQITDRFLGDDQTGVTSTGRRTTHNRVSLGVIDPTDEGLAILEEELAGMPVCVDITISPTPPSGPLTIVAAPGEAPTYPPGLDVVTWQLDPAFPPPTTADTEIHVLATERGCASGREMGDALRGPQVLETETEVIIVFAVEPVVGGANCQGNPSTPVTVELSQPIGDRQLVDAASG